MAMNELRKEVEAAAMAELNRANAKFPLFNSTHEGYAVILEEAEEAQEAMENVKTSLAVLLGPGKRHRSGVLPGRRYHTNGNFPPGH